MPCLERGPIRAYGREVAMKIQARDLRQVGLPNGLAFEDSPVSCSKIQRWRRTADIGPVYDSERISIRLDLPGTRL